MKWTVALITDGKSPQRMMDIVESVYNQPGNLNDRQLLVVGGQDLHYSGPNFKWISFDETIKSGWITKKKQIAVHEAMFPNLVILHDYIKLDTNFFESFEKFGDSWDCCTVRILNTDGSRWRDNVLWDDSLPMNKHGIPHPLTVRWVDYRDSSKTHIQYISGSAMIVKKEFMIKCPLNLNLCHAQSEDIEWSRRARNQWSLKCNPNAILHLLKEKPVWPPKDPINYNWKENGGINENI